MNLSMFKDILDAAGDKIETLKCMPHKIEDGVVYNFNDTAMFNVANEDGEIFATDDLGKRYTDALAGRYMVALKDVKLKAVIGDTPTATKSKPGIDPLYAKVIAAVGEGDKKSVRSLCKELVDKWVAFDADDVEDALDDIKDCVADKDSDAVLKIFNEFDPDTTPDAIPVMEVPADEPKPAKTKELDASTKEILEDLETAIADADDKDIKELLDELAEDVGEDSDVYKEWAKKCSGKAKPVKDDPVKEDAAPTVEAEIIEDLEAAINDGDADEAKALLEELADEVGEESPVYKEWAAKVAPAKRERKRRG